MFRGHTYVQFLMQTSVSFDLHLTILGKLPTTTRIHSVCWHWATRYITMNPDDWKDRFVNSAFQDTAKYIHISLQSYHSS